MDALRELIGESAKIERLRRQVLHLLGRERTMRRLPPILIQGETGTGKGLLARVMHRGGPHASGPFVDLNCAAIPDALLEAELFGYERGAFTDARQSKPGLVQAANGGTLFLDEIGLLPRGLQPKLLTVLEVGSVRRLGALKSEAVSVSIIAATNVNLLAEVREGRFREDLYHRLAVVTLEVPPLRERAGDIVLLAEHVLTRVCDEYNVAQRALSDDARAALLAYDWPGNVRELANVIERAVLLSDSPSVTGRVLDLPGTVATPVEVVKDAWELRKYGSREHLTDALQKTGWNITRTAVLLGVTRNTIRAGIERYGLEPSGEAARSTRSRVARGPSPGASISAFDIEDERPVSRVSLTVGVRWERRRVTFVRMRVLGAGVGASPTSTKILDLLVDKVQSFGGRVEEIDRSALVAVFGYEPAEDAPRRAANAAIAIMKAIGREQAAGDLPFGVSVAMAIHMSRVLVAPVTGAARIDQEGKRKAITVLDQFEPRTGGEIAVSEAAVDTLVRHFTLLPSMADDRSGHRLVGRGVAADATAVEFIGRGQEMELLQSLLDRATRGQGQAVLIVGGAGIGKSRLLQEFRQHLPGDAIDVFEGRCAAYGANAPYFPILEILQGVCGIQEADPFETVDAKVVTALDRVGPSGAAWSPYVQYLLNPRKRDELSGQTPELIKACTFDALQHLVLWQQDRRPLLLVIEDLHWVDKTSEELLASLAEVLLGVRVLLIATCRAGYQPSWIGRPNVTQIGLGPLSPLESRRLVESVLGAESSSEALVSAILARAEGNPFFLEELARGVGGQQAVPSIDVPNTIHDVLAARIDALAEIDRQVLQFAAVIGRDVPFNILREVSTFSSKDLRASLARLQSAEFLYAVRLGAEPEYAFKHSLIHDVAYIGLLEEDRPRVHLRVAQAIEKLAPETGERRPETLARHYREAGRQAEAIAYLDRAGQLAVQRSAHADAVAHLSQGLKLLEMLPETPDLRRHELKLRLTLLTSLAATRGYAAPEVEETLGRIQALMAQLGETAQLFPVRWGLWRFHFSRANFRRAEALAAELVANGEQEGDAAGRFAGLVATGSTKFYIGEFSDARASLEQALSLYDPAKSQAQILAYGQDLGAVAGGFLGWALAVIGDVDGAVENVDQAIRLARRIDHPLSLVLALFLAAEVHQLRRDAPVVQALGEEILMLSRDHGFTLFTAFGLNMTGWAQMATGDRDGGLGKMRKGAELFRSVGQRAGLIHRAYLAEAFLSVGSIEEALDVVTEALQRSKETAEGAFVAEVLRVQGEIFVQRSKGPDAEASFRQAIHLAAQQGAWLFALRAACRLAALSLETGSRARDALDVLGGITHRFRPTLEYADLLTARALLGRAGDA